MKAYLKDAKQFDGLHKYRGNDDQFTAQEAVIDPHNGRQIAIARWYFKGQTCMCCLWVHGDNFCASGAGSVKGGGYHKQSAALQLAILRANIAISEPIDGRGDTASTDALEAIARAVTGLRKVITCRAYA